MTGDEIITYLANIIAVAISDNALSSHEKLALEQIYAEINAKKSEIKAAKKFAEGTEFSLRLVSRFSDQVRNLEDMVLVCLVDGEMSDLEKKMISTYVKQTKITQDQFTSIYAACLSGSESLKGIQKCPNCQNQSSTYVKFCSVCGTAIGDSAQSKSMALTFEYPAEGISIEFAESTAATYELALKQASTASNFQTIVRGSKKWFLATWPKAEFPKVIDLADNLKGFRNRRSYVDGKEIAWNELFGFLWCFRQRQAAFSPAEYCFGVGDNAINLWGCKQIQMDWSEWAGWFSHGRFIKDDIFQFDREKIAHELKTNLHRVRYCPHLRKSLIETVFKLLPETVNVSKDGNWHYRGGYHQSPNSIKIVEKRKFGDLTAENEFFADGVNPFGYEVAGEILRKAFRFCGITDVDCKEIVGNS